MDNKISKLELAILEQVWDSGDLRASEICELLAEKGWNPNTVYATIKRCIDKGFLKRLDPGYWCHAALTRELFQKIGTDELIEQRFDGSATKFFASFIDTNVRLTLEDYIELRELLDKRIKEEKNNF